MEVTREMVVAAENAYKNAPTLGWVFDQPPMKFALEAVLSGNKEEKVLDIHEFDTLIDVYQDAQKSGTPADRVNARFDLKNAYRAALRAAGKGDR